VEELTFPILLVIQCPVCVKGWRSKYEAGWEEGTGTVRVSEPT